MRKYLTYKTFLQLLRALQIVKTILFSLTFNFIGHPRTHHPTTVHPSKETFILPFSSSKPLNDLLPSSHTSLCAYILLQTSSAHPPFNLLPLILPRFPRLHTVLLPQIYLGRTSSSLPKHVLCSRRSRHIPAHPPIRRTAHTCRPPSTNASRRSTSHSRPPYFPQFPSHHPFLPALHHCRRSRPCIGHPRCPLWCRRRRVRDTRASPLRWTRATPSCRLQSRRRNGYCHHVHGVV